MWPFEQYLTGQAESAIEERVTLSSAAKFYHEVVLKSYPAIIQFRP